MKKIVISLALFVVTIGAVLALAVEPIKKWDDSTSGFVYVWPVTSDNILDIDTKKFPLTYKGTLADNGSIALGGYYHIPAQGESLTIADNGTLGVAVGEKFKLVLGNGVTLGGAANGLTLTAANGTNINAASSLYLNGATLQTIEGEYVGSTTGYRVHVTNTDL